WIPACAGMTEFWVSVLVFCFKGMTGFWVSVLVFYFAGMAKFQIAGIVKYFYFSPAVFISALWLRPPPLPARCSSV
ncbi:TPA: hypothetical protein ACFMWC_000393, partial [Neisseria lactamica]